MERKNMTWEFDFDVGQGEPSGFEILAEAMNEIARAILLWHSVTWFTDSPDTGDPACVCSLCGEVIPFEAVPIRFFHPDNLEARFHLVCFQGSGLAAFITASKEKGHG